MKKLILLAALLLPGGLYAQNAVVAGRAAVGADVKLVKGLHLKVEEEVRMDDGFDALASLRTSAGLSYKPVKYVKLGAGYTLITPWSASNNNFKALRHRAYGDVTGYLRWGDVQLSLKERLQYTRRTGDVNTCQTNPNALVLKSRFKVEYKRWKLVEPSLAFELRTALNEPWGYTTGSEKTSDSGNKYYDFTFTGYTHAYNNRYRGIVAADFRLAKHHHLTPYVLLDYCNDYEIDTNSSDNWATKGIRLFSAEYVKQFRVSVGLSYELHF